MVNPSHPADVTSPRTTTETGNLKQLKKDDALAGCVTSTGTFQNTGDTVYYKTSRVCDLK